MPGTRFTKAGAAEAARHADASPALAEAIALTAEVCGRSLSPAAVDMLAEDLAEFEEAAVLAALGRCRLELQGGLRASDIIARLDDGRPGAQEAWEMMPRSEAGSVVWTEEMVQAWATVASRMASDPEGARETFCKAYAQAVQAARLGRRPVRWTPSLGSDPVERERALLEAMRKRRLSPQHVSQLLPPGAISAEMRQLAMRLKIKNFH